MNRNSPRFQDQAAPRQQAEFLSPFPSKRNNRYYQYQFQDIFPRVFLPRHRLHNIYSNTGKATYDFFLSMPIKKATAVCGRPVRIWLHPVIVAGGDTAPIKLCPWQNTLFDFSPSFGLPTDCLVIPEDWPRVQGHRSHEVVFLLPGWIFAIWEGGRAAPQQCPLLSACSLSLYEKQRPV